MSAHGFPILTPLGRVHIGTGALTRALCRDFGLTMDTLRVLGPYVLLIPTLEPASASALTARALRDCYVAAHGLLVHCTHMSSLCAPVTRILAVLRASTRYVLCCDRYDTMQAHPAGTRFSVHKFEDTDFQRVRVLELYNYNYRQEYQLVLFPSPCFLRELQACCTYCLDDGRGWLAVDARECPLSRFRCE
ncbi:MHC class II antigen presentation inhibitor [Equine molluscum contagiosum-like virus]|nr:MHC class II antigen presentation inhibitor [Equine molluscum contagiosum-like virus]